MYPIFTPKKNRRTPFLNLKIPQKLKNTKIVVKNLFLN